MTRTLLLLALASGLASGAAAQSPSDYGSIYSRFALGQRYDFSTSQADAMGVSGVALRSGLYNGLSNPALGGDQTLTTFSATALVRGVNATDASGATSEATAGDLGMLQVGIPLSSGRVGLTLAYRPYTRVDYRASQEDSIAVDGGDMIDYRTNLEGSGGLQRISAGVGVKVNNAINVGVTAETLLGTVEYLQRTEFPGASAAFLETREAEATRLYGFTGTVGATATLRKLTTDDDAIVLAGSFTLPTTLYGSRAITLGTSLDRDTLSTQDDGNVTIPYTVRAGLTYQRGTRFLVSTDAVYEPWNDFESDFTFGGYEPSGESELRSRWRVGAGLEWTPGAGQRNASYFERVSYRLGGYTETGLAAPSAQDVLTQALTGGLSLPTRLGGSRLDLGFEVGTRGGTEGVLVRDRFWRGTLTLNFGERWFVRRRLG